MKSCWPFFTDDSEERHRETPNQILTPFFFVFKGLQDQKS